MSRKSTRALFTAHLAAAIGLFGFASTASADELQVLKLDAHAPANSMFSTVPPVQTVAVPAGQTYVLTVSGTVGIWNLAPGDPKPLCGVPDAAPMEPSPGVGPKVATWDAATVYGAGVGYVITPTNRACVDLPLPQSAQGRATGFEIANGGAYSKPTPFGGIRTVPRADHTYSYEVVGTGAPLNLRFVDSPVDDNSGVLTVTVRTSEQCAAINCLGNQTPQSDATAVPPPSISAAPGGISVLGTRTCNLDKVLSIRPVQKKGVKFAKTVYAINGTKVRTVSGSKIFIGRTKAVRAQKFRNLPSGTLSLVITIKTTKGQTIVIKKSVARCMPRIKARTVQIS